MLLSSILVKIAQTALKSQRADGSMPGGHNGPWNHTDTSVRTTAHWALSFNKVFEITGDPLWKVASLKCGDYLISPSARPFDASFYCRVDHENLARQNNGLIGQAWALEALIELGNKFRKDEYLEVATTVVRGHRYSYGQHGWKNFLVDGSQGTFDRTVNQQIWFSVVARRLSERIPEVGRATRDFFDHLSRHISFLQTGTVRHVTDESFWNLACVRRRLLGSFFPCTNEDQLIQLSLGYQSFILVALFSYLRETGASHTDFPFLERILRFSLDKSHDPLYRENSYCYGYNVTGIELAYVAECLGDSIAASWWLNQQFAWTRGPGGQYLSLNVSDPLVVQSRIYEIYRLKSDYEIGV